MRAVAWAEETGSSEAVALPAGTVKAWDARGYLACDEAKARLAERLVSWLSQSTVREYASPKGYRMLIVGQRCEQ